MSLRLPIFDISDVNQDIAVQLVETASRYGFFYIKLQGSGIDPSEIASMFDLAKVFFKAPKEEKAQYAVASSQSGKNSGFFGMQVERLDPETQKKGDFKEAFNVNEFVNGKPQQGFPYTLAPRAADMHAFAKTCRSICSRVLEVIALGLGIDPVQGGQDWFSPRHDLTHGQSGSVLRFLYYPKIEPEHQYDAASDLRCGAHSDYGTVTLLFQLQGQPGLEILRDAQTWSAVPVNPTSEPDVPILVNIGDLLSYWTNGYLKSAVHRVIAADSSAPERYSIAYFCHPLDDAKLDPVPSAVVQRHQPEARNGGVVITAREHLEARLRATYT